MFSQTAPCRIRLATRQPSCRLSSTPSPRTAAHSPDAGAASQKAFTLIHPNTEFKSTMKSLRKQYLASSLASKLAAEKESQLKASLSEKDRQARLDDIKAFKKMREATTLHGSSNLHADPVTGAIDPTAASSVDSALPPSASVPDPVSRKDYFQEYVARRRVIRFETELNRQSKLAYTRGQSLMHLFHTADSFITYQNLDAALDLVFDNSIGGSRSSKDREEELKGVGLQGVERRRQEALADAARGTVSGGKLGVGELVGWLQQREREGDESIRSSESMVARQEALAEYRRESGMSPDKN